ncbi:hypothetical protein [Spiribacter vilamensis]|uniref:Uncharacterized protein n=1 Tax=Spiribacter vilamensis TaxID=531306 RepID=A0A4Q8D318_9GAMM|nr:hypothetical protein [Spiribacter vilamensis]RZU99720.1 hypothetical protein EV698_2022 [Spiribacter vilamensis]TVO61333.1 hypothetical protein FPL09_04125 [Spiribacter vilamensis]
MTEINGPRRCLRQFIDAQCFTRTVNVTKLEFIRMPPLHKWEITVSSGSYFPHLAQNFPGDDISLSDEDEEEQGIAFYAYSRHVDELDTPAGAAQRIYSLQLLLNGALRLEWEGVHTHSVRFNTFGRIGSGEINSVYARSIEENPFSESSVIDEGLGYCKNPKVKFSAHLLYLAKTDEDLRTLLFLVGLVSTESPIESILTWNTLYRIVDTVKNNAKYLNCSLEEFADKNKIKAFKAACNNMSIIGLNARHGAANNEPPPQVITDLDEAINLIIPMATKFCQFYVQARHP